MAMTGASHATMSKLLRTVYAKRVVRVWNDKHMLAQAFGRVTQDVKMGEKFSVPLEVGAGSGYRGSKEGYLGPADPAQIERAEFFPDMITNRISVTEALMQDAEAGVTAEWNPLQKEIDSKTRSMRHDWNHDLFQDGSGILCDFAASPTATATTAVVKSVTGLRRKMLVDVLIKTTGVPGSGGVIGVKLDFNKATNVITLLGGKTFGDGTGAEINGAPTTYAVYRHGSYNAVPWGLKAIVAATNPTRGLYGGIDRTSDSNDFFRAPVLANGGTLRAPRPKLIQDAIDEIEKNAGEESEGVDLILTSHQIWSHLMETFINAQRRSGAELQELNGWAAAIKFADLPAPIVKDKHCGPNDMWILNTRTFHVYQTSAPQWQDRHGSVLIPTPDQIAYEARLFWRHQVCCDNPAANGLLTDLAYVAPA